MKLTKSEAHFRTKIIQELHLKKYQQQMIDRFAKSEKRSYCDIYYTIRISTWLDGLEGTMPSIQNAVDGLSKAMADCAVAAINAINEFYESLNDLLGQYTIIYEESQEKGLLR